jgi:DNA-binding transcriptional MerR regulator
MDIADVARRSGVPASTLRFYEEKGLIVSLARPGARRQFAAQILDQLALISLGQSAGFSLEEIRSMFAGDGGTSIDRQMLAAKADELDATIRRLRAMSRGLRHAAACPAPSHAQCPTFQRLVKAAGASTLEGKKERGRLKKGRTAD